MIEITKGGNMQVNYEDILKIQPRGVLTIPKKLRDVSGISENSLVKIRADKGRLILESVRTLPYPVRSYKKDDLKDFFELDDQETNMLKKMKRYAK
jgi:bifunctional DNA-binding transcriptional regulator/antitoxin component of YhaV-PrlF toxin-antitoxin module